MFELRTERLTFRPGVASDVEAIHAIVSNWEVVKNLGSWPYPADLAYTINRIVGRLDIDKGIAGTVRAGDEIIGGMGIVEGDLGYAFGPSAWGKGYATEISRRLVSYVMHCYDWPQLTAEAYSDNPASARVLEKIGFEEIGIALVPCAARGGEVDARKFVLTRERWDALRNTSR